MRVRAHVKEALGSDELAAAATRPPRTLVGGLGYRWQRDASFGLAVSDALARLEWPDEVEVADLGYGALHVADELRHAAPAWERLILVAAAPRGRAPGGLFRREWTPAPVAAEEVQARIREAGAGVIDLDHLLVIGQHFESLPPRVVLYELEPAEMDGGEGLSRVAEPRLEEAVERVRREALTGGAHGP